MTTPTGDRTPGQMPPLRTRAFALGLLGLLVVSCPGLWFGGQTLFFRDFGTLAYPVVHYHREAFWRGELLPLWNPLSHCGTPFFAQWNTLTAYPLALFYLLLPLPWSLNVFCLLHLLLGGVGLYRLGRTLAGDDWSAAFGGVAYALGGGVLASHIYPNYLVALGWWPWVLLSSLQAMDKGGRAIPVAACVGAMQVLSGAPELLWQTWGMLGMLALARFIHGTSHGIRALTRCVAVGLFVTGLTAFQMLPFLDLLHASQRDGDYATALWTLPLSGWANWLVPLFHSFRTPQGLFAQSGQAFLATYYCGLGTVVFATLALRNRRARTEVAALALFAVAGLCLAVGDALPLNSLCRKVFPPLTLVRFPVKFLYSGILALPLMAAAGLAWIRNTSSTSGVRGPIRPLLATALATLTALAGVLLVARLHPTPGESFTTTSFSALVSAGFLMATIAAATGASAASSPRARLACLVGLPLLVWADVRTSAPGIMPTLPAEVLSGRMCEAKPPPAPGESRLFTTPEAERLLLTRTLPNLTNDFLGSRLAAWSNLNLLEGLPKVNGAMTLQIREEAQLEKRIYSRNQPPPAGLLDLLAVSHESAPHSPVEWVGRTNQPGWLMVGAKPVLMNATNIPLALLDPMFNPRTDVLLASDAEPEVRRISRAVPEARILRWSLASASAEAEVETPAPTLLVLSQSLTPNWSASLDGQPVVILRADHAFQAVPIPDGKHLVRFRYSERSLPLGGTISGLALAGALLMMSRSRNKTGSSVPARGNSDPQPR